MAYPYCPVVDDGICFLELEVAVVVSAELGLYEQLVVAKGLVASQDAEEQ